MKAQNKPKYLMDMDTLVKTLRRDLLRARIDANESEEEYAEALSNRPKSVISAKYRTFLWSKCRVETLEQVLFMIKPSLAE